jgi:hypothetical protein
VPADASLDDLYDYVAAPARPGPRRANRASVTLTVTDNWPEDVPVTEAEIAVFEAWFGELFDELFGGAEGDITMAAAVRAALYLRVSTGRQADNDLSIPDQRRQAKAYCGVCATGELPSDRSRQPVRLSSHEAERTSSSPGFRTTCTSRPQIWTKASSTLRAFIGLWRAIKTRIVPIAEQSPTCFFPRIWIGLMRIPARRQTLSMSMASGSCAARRRTKQL